MFVRIHALKKFLDLHENILVYGTGKYAKIFYEACAKLDAVSKISFFVTSFAKDKEKFFHGIPVERINEIDIKMPIFIAAGHENRIEIERLLIQIGAHKISYAEDYLRGDFLDSANDWLQGKDFMGYCEEIAEWYVYEHPECIDRFDQMVERLVQLGVERSDKTFHGKNIVFIVERIRARYIKFIEELIQQGYEVSLLHRTGRIRPYVAEDDINELGIDVKRCSSTEEVFYFILHSPSKLLYIDNLLGYGYNNLASHVIRCKQYFGTVIYDPYDIKHGSYPDKASLEYVSERYSFEHADGIISRYLDQFEYLRNNFHMKLNCPFLEFMDYCESSKKFKKIEIREKKPLKLCWCVSHAKFLIERNVGDSGYIHTVPVRELLEYIGQRRDYLIDIYVWEASDEQKEIFRVIEKEHNTIHFFYKTPHSKFIGKLQLYDYGMELCVNKKIPKWPDAVEGYSENSWINSTVNKYFDFLSAGVPIIADNPLAMCRFLSKEYDCLVEMSAKDFDIDYLNKKKIYYKERALEARNLLSIDKHIGRLIKFLEHVRGV